MFAQETQLLDPLTEARNMQATEYRMMFSWWIHVDFNSLMLLLHKDSTGLSYTYYNMDIRACSMSLNKKVIVTRKH